MDRLKKYSTCEAKTLQYIYEFLVSNNMTKTSDCFLEECHKLNMPVPSKAITEISCANRPLVHLTKDHAASIIQSFKSASRSRFMKTWNDLPDEMKQMDEYRKLTFYLHVYYTVLECKKRVGKSDVIDCNDDDGEKNDESSMDAFRAFLLRRGAEFSTETEFLPYFALPYVFNPMQHPSFKNLFKENLWCDSLQKRLEDFVLDIAISTSVVLVPRKDARKRKATKKKFKSLYKEYKPLNVLAAELLNALENSIRGQSINLEIILKSFHAVVENDDEKRNSAKMVDDRFDLAVFKIKLELRDGNSTKNKLLILQALRWRLTRSNRADTVVMIRKHDLLDLRKPKAEQGIAKWLMMTNGPHPLQQMVSRLLNALASFNKGRKYLTGSPFLTRLIVTQLVSSQHFWDTITCNMLLGTLQKLSTGSRERKRMNEYGMTAWLADQLVRKSEFTGDRNKYEMYDLEYSLALFMNLSRSPSAVRACKSRARNLFKSLTVFLTSLDVDITPCIAAILYNFLKRPEMVTAAREEGLTGVVDKIVENNINAYPSAVEQLTDVRNLLLQNVRPDRFSDDEDEDDDDSDDDSSDGEDGDGGNADDNAEFENLEAELDEDDPLKIEPNGEDFLADYKTARDHVVKPATMTSNDQRTTMNHMRTL